jgi:hypothetical protein
MQPNVEMSYGQATFDLKAARKMHGDGYPGFYLPREIMDTFSAALDEIERLQADIITHDDAWQNDRAANAKRIAELEAALHVEKSAHEETKYADSEAANQAFSRIAKQRATIKKLGTEKRDRGKALVEERDRFNVAMKVVPLNTSFPNSDHKKAREQLRQEGKL